MVRTIGQRCFQADQRISCQYTVLHRFANALFDCGPEVLGHRTAENAFCKYEILVGTRLKVHLNMTILTMTARLFLVLALNRYLFTDFLAVRYNRLGQLHFNTKLVFELGADNIQMNVAHTRNQHLLGFGIVFGRKGRVFVAQTCQTGRQLFFVAFVLGCNALRIARLGQYNRLQVDLAHRHRQCIAGLSGDQLSNCTDITAAHFGHFGGFLAADFIDMCHFFIGIGAAVHQRHILLDRTGEYLKVRESAVLVCNGLENHRNRRTVGRAVNLNQLALFIFTDFNRCFVWRRHVISNALEQRIRADTGRNRTTEYRRNDQIAHALTDTGNQFFIGKFFASEVALHQFFRQFGHVLAQSRTVLIDAVNHVVRNRDFDTLGAFHLVCLADNAVNNADGIAVALENRDDNRTNRNTELLLQLVQRSIVIGIFLVNFGYVEHTRHSAFFSALPRLFGANARP